MIAQPLFITTWLGVGAVEGHGFSPVRDDISDLAALTAHHPTYMRLGVGLAGALTIAFALFALRPALKPPRASEPLGAWLTALSLPALDNFTDTFFRLDCRAADDGCSATAALSSWHARLHVAFFVIAAIATLVAPFALAHRMRVVAGWRDFAVPTRAFGFVTVVALAVTVASSGTPVQGLAQRAAATVIPLGIVALAWRAQRLIYDGDS
jgi:hypothetical protein